MIRQNICIKDLGWLVRCFYDVDSNNADEILNLLWDMGCEIKTIERAERNLKSNKKDTGLCYSNFRNKESVFVISETSSAAEFVNSWHHELSHLESHISDVFHLNRLGETASYISGDIAKKMFPKIKHLMCDCCRNKAE